MMKMNFLSCNSLLIGVGIFCLITGCCKKNSEEKDPFKVISLGPLTGDIPFEALGSGRILFQRVDPSNNTGIYLMDADRKSTYGFKLNTFLLSPFISPDGSKIVCSLRTTSNQNFIWGIYCMNIDGTNCFPVTESGGGFCPTWSPDGLKILYSVNGSDGPLYMLSATEYSNDKQEVTKFNYGDDPDWFIIPIGGFSMSPDGQLVCASRGGSKTVGILKIEPYIGKTGVSVIIPYASTEEPIASVFSQDGTKIALAILERNSLGYNQAILIKSMDPDGTNIITLARTEISDEAIIYSLYPYMSRVSLCWSPDGQKILFSVPAANDGRYHLMVVNADGSGLTQVTDEINTDDYYVSWGR